jgi:hypothetical protein
MPDNVGWKILIVDPDPMFNCGIGFEPDPNVGKISDPIGTATLI